MSTVVELYRQVKFNAFLHPNEHPERICLYLVRQFEVELAKNPVTEGCRRLEWLEKFTLKSENVPFLPAPPQTVLQDMNKSFQDVH